jgi:hypothetical protein
MGRYSRLGKTDRAQQNMLYIMLYIMLYGLLYIHTIFIQVHVCVPAHMGQ